MIKPAYKRIVLIGDLHVGSGVGLTMTPHNKVQKKLLELYKSDIVDWQKPDILVINGDAVDGPQTKNKGKGQTELNLNAQDQDAANLIALWKAKEIFIVSGSEYHTGEDEHEENLGNLLRTAGNKVTFVDKLHVRINGWFKIQARHFIPPSKVPYSRTTASAREAVSEILNAYASGGRAANLLIFSHVHYYTVVKDDITAAITLPCWQAVGSKFGDKKCSGRVVLGCIQLHIAPTKEGGWRWDEKLHKAGLVSRCLQR